MASEPTREERIEAIQAAMVDDEFLSVARADDLRWLLKELAEASNQLTQMRLSELDALDEARERATAAEGNNAEIFQVLQRLREELERERGDTKRLNIEMRVRLDYCVFGHELPEEFCRSGGSAYRSAFENAWRGKPFSGTVYTRSDCRRAWCQGYQDGEKAVREAIDAAMGVAEPTGGKPE